MSLLNFANDSIKLFNKSVPKMIVRTCLIRIMKVGILRSARDWEILNCIKLTQHYKMH
jgi:hypothetical protein